MHPSFSDRTGVNGNATKDGKLGYQQIPGWNGKCEPGEFFSGSNCNQKLIGARYYNQGFGGNAGVKAVLPYEILSPRDYDGHGTHTASTAGGNETVRVTGAAGVLGSISGMAPRARIAAYKVCWGVGGTANAGCYSSDSVAAIDQAVADGVDVINFSISGTSTNFRDPVEIAWLYAADAGVFVATSAGNSGPATSTVAHPSPWVTTVAAGTHDRDGAGTLTLGNGAVYNGASLAATSVTAPIVNSTDVGKAGADAGQVALCYSSADGGNVLDPATVTQDPSPTDPTGTVAVNVSIPTGSTYARFALFDSDVVAGADMDLYVYQGATLVGASTTGTSAEEVNFSFSSPTTNPIALTVYVHGWGIPGGSSPFVLNQFSIGTAAAGNFSVTAPATATVGGTGTITVTPDAALPAGRWLGSVFYEGAAGMPSPTIVNVIK